MARRFNPSLHPRDRKGEFAKKGGGGSVKTKSRSKSRSSGSGKGRSISANPNYVAKNSTPTGKHKGPNIQARSGVTTSATKTRADLHNKQPQTVKLMSRSQVALKSFGTGAKTGAYIGLGLGAIGVGVGLAGHSGPFTGLHALSAGEHVANSVLGTAATGATIGLGIGIVKAIRHNPKKIRAAAKLSGAKISHY